MAKPKRSPPTVCACPEGARAKRTAGVLSCSRDGAPVEPNCAPGAAAGRAYRVGSPQVGDDLFKPSTFDYTTPNTVPATSAKERKSDNCLTKRISAYAKKGARKGQLVHRTLRLPYRCPPGSSPTLEGTCRTATGTVEPQPQITCGPSAAPCSNARNACPVQLVYKAGQPHLRFCGPPGARVNKKGQTVRVGSRAPSWLVPVKTPSSAQELAARACKQWLADGERFTDKNVAVQQAKAAGAGYTGPNNALGRSLAGYRRR